MIAVIKGCIKPWHPTGEVRFWRDGSITRNWTLQYEWSRVMVDYTQENQLKAVVPTDLCWVETDWRNVPFVEVN